MSQSDSSSATVQVNIQVMVLKFRRFFLAIEWNRRIKKKLKKILQITLKIGQEVTSY